MLSFQEIQFEQQIAHEKEQATERKRFFRQQRKKFTITNMLVPFNVVLRKTHEDYKTNNHAENIESKLT